MLQETKNRVTVPTARLFTAWRQASAKFRVIKLPLNMAEHQSRPLHSAWRCGERCGLGVGWGRVLHVGQLVAAGETLCGHQMQVTYRHCKCKLILTVRYMKWTQKFGSIIRQQDKSNTVVSMFGTPTFRENDPTTTWPASRFYPF